MIHGYHLILPIYGVWLPNDPRGSWSAAIWKWELVRYGQPTRSLARRALVELTPDELRRRAEAQASLQYPVVQLTGLQAKSVGDGFGEAAGQKGYAIWACAILPEHTHLVLARHTYKVEQIATLLKGAATRRIISDGRHPLQAYQEAGARMPCMWAEKRWKIFLDSEHQIEAAIRYVDENPERENKPRQHWPFVVPFRGLESGHIVYH